MIDTANQCTPVLPALAGIDEILALVVNVSRERVLELTFRSDFPAPAAELAQGDIWYRDDVQAWLDDHRDAVASMLIQAPVT